MLICTSRVSLVKLYQYCLLKVCATDSLVESELIKQRASETCSYWRNNNVFDAVGEDQVNYLNTGRKYSNNSELCYIIK